MIRNPWHAWTFVAFFSFSVVFGATAEALASTSIEVELKSPSAILIDASSGQVLFAKNADERREPASITKVVTLALTMKALREGKVALTDQVTASPYATSFGGSQIWLEPGEAMSLEDLIYAIAVGSANDASVAVAEHIAGSEQKFVQEMNELARQAGAKNTHFNNPHGLPDANHFVSARDMAIIARYLVTQYPEVLRYTSQWEYFLREDTNKKLWLVNTNKGLKHFSGMDGLKTGWTSTAGFNLVATAKRGSTRLIGVTLGAERSADRFLDMYRMLNEGFANFETVEITKAGERVATLPVLEGRLDEVGIVTGSSLAITVAKGEADSIEKKLVTPKQVTAPIQKGQKVGSIVALSNGKELGTVDLVAAETVNRAPIWQLFLKFARWMWPLTT